MHLRALGIIDGLLESEPLNVELRVIAGHELMSAGEAAARTGDSLEGMRLRQASAERFRSLVTSEPANELLRFDLGWALSDLGESLHERRDLDAAGQSLREARDLLRGLAGFVSPRFNTTQFLAAMNDVRIARLKLSQADASSAAQTERRALLAEAKSLMIHADQVIRAAENDELLGQEAREYRAMIASALQTFD